MDKNAGLGMPGLQTPAVDIEAIDAFLGTLDIVDEVELDIVEEIIEPILETAPVEVAAIAELPLLSEDEIAAVEAGAARAEAYADAPAGSDIAEIAAVVPGAAIAAAVTTAKVAKVRAPSTPRAERNITALPDSAFVLSIAAPPSDLVANKATVLTLRPTQKKIADKFDNLIVSVAAGKRPSVYTAVCFELLSTAPNGTVTQTDLVKGLMATNKAGKADVYNEGTARSQAGQIMVLFDTLGIATRTKQSLVINPDSALGAQLAKILAGPAVTATP